MRILVIIPAYNEATNILSVVESLKTACPTYDYVVINDASTDETGKILKDNSINHINLPTNLGIGGSVQCGYKYAVANDYDVAIQMDGDGQHLPQYYPDAVKLIENGEADIVIGSRFITKEGFQTSFARRVGIKFVSKLIRFVCGENIKDVTSGYRITNKKMTEIYARKYAQDYPEPEAIVVGNINGAKFKEIPVVMNERMSGKSSISPLKGVLYMVKVSLVIIFCKIVEKNSR